MIQLSEEHLYILNQLINKNIPFVIYKMPHENEWHFRIQTNGDLLELSTLSELNLAKGYIIAPFHVSSESPILLMRADSEQIPCMEEVEKFSNYSSFSASSSVIDKTQLFNDYKIEFSKFMKPLLAHEVEKLVLARQQTLNQIKPLSPSHSFLRACNTYPNAYVYLLNTPQTGVWLGSTPELLLAGNHSSWKTVALAGTQAYKNDISRTWDDKNLHEQDLVVQYLKKQLNLFGVEPDISGPTDIHAGQVVHLVSEFNFVLDDRNRLGDLLNLLHPTPAVCGTPKEFAFEFIRRNESKSRKYYSGFLGELDPQGKTDLFVNLRCMQIQQKTCTLYAGGGLLSSSILEDEWKETQNKMLTMQALLLKNSPN